MKGITLYEKKFPKFDPNEINAESSSSPEENQPLMSFEEFYQKRVEPLCAVPIKEKREKADAFINAAIDASNIYEFDVEIVQYPNMVAVEYSFDMGVFLDELKPVLVMADNYCLFKGKKGKNIDFLIQYNTHKFVDKSIEDKV